MNALVRLFADAANARTKQENGFDLTRYDQRALEFAKAYSRELLAIDVNVSVEQMLDTGWRLMAAHFEKTEVGIKQAILDKYWKVTK